MDHVASEGTGLVVVDSGDVDEPEAIIVVEVGTSLLDGMIPTAYPYLRLIAKMTLAFVVEVSSMEFLS